MSTFKITSFHSVAVDSFTEGEGENVNNYHLSAEITAKDLPEAISLYFENTLCYSLNFDNLNKDNDQIFYSTLVNGENEEIKENCVLFQEWKVGRAKLYSNVFEICAQELKPVFLS